MRFVLVLLLLLASFARAQPASDANKPLVYNQSDEDSKTIELEAKKAYAAKFRFIDIPQKGGFSLDGEKGRFGIPFQTDPRSMREEEKPCTVAYAFIVTPSGGVIEPLILHSTDPSVSKHILDRILYVRYFPARLHGTPVYSLHTREWKFGGPYTGSRQSGDGLGVYHSRDR